MTSVLVNLRSNLIFDMHLSVVTEQQEEFPVTRLPSSYGLSRTRNH
jgi:hypothetical protein